MSKLYKNSKKNREYWNDRVASSIWKTYNTLEDKNRDLLQLYQEATLDIQNELYRLADRIAKNGVITRTDAYKNNRLKKLQKSIEKRIQLLTDDILLWDIENKRIGIELVYKDINKLLEIKHYNLTDTLIEQLLRSEWQGSFFSDNLWENSEYLVANLNDVLVQGIIQGKPIADMSIELSNRMNKSFNVTHRLVRTETVNVLNNTAIKSYKDSGKVKKVQVWAAVDERLCKTCGKYHGNIYNIDDVIHVPIHPSCRCTILPVIDDEEAKEDHKKAKEEVKEEFKKR